MARTNNTVQSIRQVTRVLLYWCVGHDIDDNDITIDWTPKKRDKLQFNLTWLHRRQDTIIYNSCNNIVIVVISIYRRMIKRVERTLIKLMKKTDEFLTDYNYYHSIWNLKKYKGRYTTCYYIYTRECVPLVIHRACVALFFVAKRGRINSCGSAGKNIR